AAEVAQQLRTDVLGLALTLDQMWAALNAGRAHLIAGRPRSALVWAGDALIVAERAGLVAGQALTASVLAAAHAQLGDRAGAEDADAIAERLAHVRGFLRAERAVGRAWTAFVRHEESTARALLLEAADMAADAGQIVSESFLLHEHLRLGGAPHAERLSALAARTSSPLVHARAAIANALHHGSSTELAAAGERFAELDLHLYAAEAFAAAARAGRGREATGHRTRSEAHRAHCEGAVTPLLEGDPGGPLALLSKREREIAALAVDGLSAREIGERLFLSVRTVENHLHRVYVKLGTTNRKELARYFSAG
ncbi:MAG: helix-turn-helix transcriptional regulator, partial [Ilumatobacter sp.]|nr:helix-turn-helix transcriptional regulator [Ilumatobacter sp.]